MQTENKILKLDGGVGSWCSEKGVLVATPSLAIGLAARFNLDLRTKELDSESRLKSVGIDELAGVVSWYIAVDSDFNQATAPVLLNTSPDVTVSATDDGRTILSFVAPNTYVSALIAAAKSSQSVTLTVEMGGYDGSGKLIFLLQFPLIMRNRVWTEGGSAPEVPQDPEYLTSAQVKALIAEATRSETPGPAGTTPHIGENGNWFIGSTDTGVRADGKDGKDGEDGEDGEDGKNAYQIAVDNGYSGSVTEWLAELKGEPGAGLQIDATGEPAELHAYDNEKAGFVFACSEIDAKAKTCTKYFYVKKSDDVGDWFDPPLAEVTYERTAEVATLEPVEFSAPAGAADYLQLDLSQFPHSWIAAVTIDTAEGELQLALGSNNGLRKIVRQDENLRIYFGSSIPAFDKGRLYLTQFVGLTDSASPEAPEPGISTDQAIYYGYITMADAGVIASVKDINQSLINTAIESGTLFHVPLKINTQYAFAVPAYSWVLALVPDGVLVQKDNGIGARTNFTEHNGLQNSGANGGSTLSLETGTYHIYGELQIVTGETTIYVDLNKKDE